MALVPPYTAMVAVSPDGWARLLLEADLMDAARQAAGSLVPAVLAQDPTSMLQIREHKSGASGWEIEERIFGVTVTTPPARLPRYSLDCPLTTWGRVFAADLGAALARLHRGMTREPIVCRLTSRNLDWAEIERVVREHSGRDLLVGACRHVAAWDMARSRGQTVLHGDPHLHNLFAHTDGRLSGVIDFEGATVGDFHEDLMYLHSQGPRFAEIAMAAYEHEAGASVDRDMVGRFHVRSAFEHFGWVRPEAPRFPRIVEWATGAARALTPEWVS